MSGKSMRWEGFWSNVNSDSGIVNTHSGNAPKSVHLQPGLGVHVGPEYAVREPLPMRTGTPERYDVEYERNGVAHLIQFSAPFVGWRRIEVADNHAANEWAEGVRKLVEEDFAQAKRITLVMGNLSTHSGASLYKNFEPQVARRLLEKLEFVFTPKHGSWLNIAECEFSVLSRQCLSRRLPDIETVRNEVDAWAAARNQARNGVDWRFTAEDARIKLKKLYPCTSNDKSRSI